MLLCEIYDSVAEEREASGFTGLSELHRGTVFFFFNLTGDFYTYVRRQSNPILIVVKIHSSTVNVRFVVPEVSQVLSEEPVLSVTPKLAAATQLAVTTRSERSRE